MEVSVKGRGRRSRDPLLLTGQAFGSAAHGESVDMGATMDRRKAACMTGKICKGLGRCMICGTKTRDDAVTADKTMPPPSLGFRCNPIDCNIKLNIATPALGSS